MVGTLFGQCRMAKESEDAQTVVDGNQHHVLGTPLLSIELWLRTEALTIATTMNPQRYGQFLANLARSFRPYVQIQAILTEGGLLTIAPLRIIATSILNGLIARTTKSVANLHTFPGHDGLRSLPTVLTNGRCSIGNATIDIHVRMVVSQDAFHLTTFNS
jgi:hypothetical protein